ncbi:MAG: amidase, partial [Acetobacteraceae bacterium]|nr:amidase [Acetobacteraceae bacterium]
SFDLPWPVARNPWNTEHVTGGSSSGSGAAIAGGMLRMATGSDTGGSIRGPAAWCGAAGIKPTYGRVSRRGVFPLSWTLDHCGPLGRSVEDCAIALQVMAGHDPDDPASVDVFVPDFRAGLEQGVAGLRIGVPPAFLAEAKMVTSEVLAGIDRTFGRVRDAGATVEDVSLPDYAIFSIAGRVIMMAEAFAIHQADMRERMLDYGERTARRFVQGAALTAVDLVDALRARRELTAAVNVAFQRYDALLTANALLTAPRFDAMPDTLSSTAPMQTIPFNVTGHPAMSVPIGLAPNRLPLSVQVVGRPLDEAMVLRVGRAVEKLSGWEEVVLPFG